MDPGKYFTLTGSPSNAPIHPGNPPIMPVGTTQVQASNLRMNYKSYLHNWALVKDSMNTLKPQILQTFDEGYLITL